MLVPSVARELPIIPSADRARRQRKKNIVTYIHATYATLSSRLRPSQPPRRRPAKDCEARIQENNISVLNCKKKLESGFLFWYGAAIPWKQCRVLRKVQRLSEVRQVIGESSNGSVALVGEDRLGLGEVSFVDGL